ncbi:mucin-3A-like [Ochlerotatus camptorhynchus]|uniref:mucin-3A-like n=1 Tax=Ochlerotatus camptorhynchus TaxID=644619 RepID=UPI0031D1FA20
MLRYTLFVVLLLQCLPLNISENSKNRIDIRNRYSPGHIQFHSPHQHLVSPINLLNPDKYEYFTINNQGNIIKRLMTSKEIQSIVAGNNVRQNVFDKLDSPHGIITNIVSSIKNVLNTELLSKTHENHHPDNNANGNIAEVTSSESSENKNEYVPTILNLVELSSHHENQENLSDSATKCHNNCDVENDPNIGITTLISHQTKSTEMYSEQATESTPQQTDENKIENMLQWLILNNNLPEATEKAHESTPLQPEENTTENEKATENTSYQADEFTTESKLMLLISNNLPELTEKATESTTYQADERITMSTVQSTLAGEEYSYHIMTPNSEASTETPSATLISSASSGTSTEIPTTMLINNPSSGASTQMPATMLISSPSSETSTQMPTTTLISSPSSETSTQMPATTFISSPSSENSTQIPATALNISPSSETSTQIPATTLISTVDDEPEQYIISMQQRCSKVLLQQRNIV